MKGRKWTQINDLEQKEEINIQPEKNEETRIQKNEERLRNLQDIFKCSNIRIIGVPEGEEEEQKIENLFEQIMKENFPHLAKEKDFQEVQEAQRVPKKLDPRKPHQGTSSLSYPRLKTRRESQKQQEKRRELPTKKFPQDYQLISQKKPYRQGGAGKRYSESRKARTYIQNYSIQESYHLEWKGR